MALYFIGLGLHDHTDISLKGLEFVKDCAVVYMDCYTGKLNSDISKLEELCGKQIIRADRDMVEKEESILLDAKDKGVAFLVVGDPMSATTHVDLMIRAKEMGIATYTIPNASVISAVGVTGLQVYKFGKTTSIPYPEMNYKPVSAYNVIKENQTLGLHTLLLLDLRHNDKKYMTVNEAIKILLDIEKDKKEGIFTEETLCIGCARLGGLPSLVKSGSAKQLASEDFGEPVHCLIVPGKMHFMEEDAFKVWQVQ